MTARPFDPHWTTDLPSLVSFLRNLCEALTLAETRKRKRSRVAQENFEAAIKAIVLDLCRANLSDPTLEVGIATGQSLLQERSHSQYGSALLSPRTFRAAIGILTSRGYVTMTTPHWDDPLGENSHTARYQATSSLIADIKKAGASFAALRRYRGSDGIQLKNERKHLVEYGNVRFANEAGDRLRTINSMLESHWADLSLSNQQIIRELSSIREKRDRERGRLSTRLVRPKKSINPPDFAARTVYRVFNNNNWREGGRFYGAWWIICPSDLRRHIIINEKRTVEVDYSGLHAAIMYAEAGLPIPNDPYERCLTKTGNKIERGLVKKTFNALVNAKSISAIRKIEGYSEEYTGRSWQSFKYFIVSCYPEFKSKFGSGCGLYLQREDSDLAESVMLAFSKMGYACLPVHDSFIVHHALQDTLISEMQKAFEKKFHAMGKVSYDIGLPETVDLTGKAVEANIDELLRPADYEARYQAFLEKNEVDNLI